jgi:outer membrane protein assembly factor BamE
MIPRHINLILIVALLLGGCSIPTLPTLPGLTPYKMDVQQGNVVTQEMIAKVQPGMTRSQVRFALGTPLIVDPFRTDRWDYVYLYQKAGVLTEQRRIAVIFKDDKLVRIDGDVVAAAPGAATPATKTDKPAAPAATPQAQPEKK